MRDDRSRSGPVDEAAVTAKRRAAEYVGKVLSGRYRIEEILALGGMGAVFRAEHVHMRKQVALKILHPMTQNLPELVARFERESIVGAHVSHPNVCRATDFGRLDDGSHYLVLEYVEGRTLHEVLKKQGRLDPSRASEIALQIASGLGAAHELGFHHRDVKPSNLMLCNGPYVQVKIVDFGLAKLPSNFHVDEKMTITTAGTIFGTVAYMAPELALGMQAVDHRADLYALGVIFYEMLAGKHPFEASEPMKLFAAHRNQLPPPIAERSPGASVPADIEAIVRKLLEKDPNARYQTAAELVEAIEEACPTAAVPPPRPSARSASEMRSRGSAPDPASEAAPPSRAAIDDPSDASPPPAPAAPADRTQGRAGAGTTIVVALGLCALAAIVWVKFGDELMASASSAPAIATPAAPPPTALVVPPSPASPPHSTPADATAAPSTSTSAAAPRASASPAAPASPEVLKTRSVLAESAAAHDAGRGARALLSLVKSAPEAFRDRDVIANAAAIAVALAIGDRTLADDVFGALSGPELGESGPDVLLYITSYYGGTRGAARATELLSMPEVIGRASPALRIAREFKAAACKDRPALYDRAASEGDERALGLLGAMLGPDCASTPGACCTPHDAQLVAAVAKLRQRMKK